jgi:hypothetical protein
LPHSDSFCQQKIFGKLYQFNGKYNCKNSPLHINTKVSQNESVTFYIYYFTWKYWGGNRQIGDRACNFARMIRENSRESRGHTFPHRKGVIAEEGGYCNFGATIREKSCLRTAACHRSGKIANIPCPLLIP